MSISRRQAQGSFGQFSSPAVVVGHPGHELKVFGWLALKAPRLYVITDGSGRTGLSRLSSTAAVINQTAALRSEIFGRLSDAEMYQAILHQDFQLFLRLVYELAASLVSHRIDCVAGDAAEGFNPTHDLCRVLINSAVRMAERAAGRKIANFEFCLTEWEQGCAATHDQRCRHFVLDDGLLERKLAAARHYAELAAEVDQAVAQRGTEYFRVECFRPVLRLQLPRPSGKPLYELWGEQRVAEGEYQAVIRFKEHVLPVAEAMLRHASCSPLEPLHAHLPGNRARLTANA